MTRSNETTPTFTTPRSAENLRNKTSNIAEIISYRDIVRFVQHQTSQEATYVRGSLDFSVGQILYDPKDRKIGSNTTSNGVVSIKPHGSSYLSRISKKNFTDQGNQGYIAVEDHVMTLFDSLYDGLAKAENAGCYSQYVHRLVADSDFHSRSIAKNKKYQPESWTQMKLAEESGTSRVFAVETALQKTDPENFTVKSFIQNGRFGHQNNCAVITNFLLILKSAFGNEAAVDEAIFSLIKKTSQVDEVLIREARDDAGILVKESIPKLDVRSVRAFFGTFLSMKTLYEQRGIDLAQHQELYTKVVDDIVSHFKPLQKEIKDDVNNQLFWNIYQKEQLTKISGATRDRQNVR